ncbi:MAG: zinc ribbon domain-containing protein [Candidatus Binatus sp.]|uniref:FmdB family zinc ribbon protein n=1 Tax=Candidatus Binatus sp. TaxID=2811406 RepID=UPI003C76DE60
MPIYEYKCNKCGVFEAMQGIKESALKKCPTCNGKVERQMSRGSFILKGSGWYATDYAKKSTPSSTDSDSASTPTPATPASNGSTASSSDSSAKAAGESKPASESKSSSSESKTSSRSKSSSEKSVSAKAAG